MRRRSSGVSTTSTAWTFSSSRAALRGPGNRDDVVTLREQPCERELRGRAALLLRDLPDLLDDVQVLLEVVALKARVVATEVACRQLLRLREATGEEAAAERAVRHEADAELFAGSATHPPRRRATTANTRSAARGCDAPCSRVATSRVPLPTCRGSAPCRPRRGRPSRRSSSSIGTVGSTRCW